MQIKLKRGNKIRIGILTHNYPTKSSESRDAGKFVYAFSQELAKKANVFVLCPNFGGKKEKYSKVPVTWFDWNGSDEKFGSWKLFSPLSLLKFVKLIYFGNKEVLSFVKKNKIDYLLCFWNFPSGIFGWYANKKLGINYSTWALGSDIYIYSKLPIAREIIQMVLKGADNRFGNSDDIGRKILKLSGKKFKFLPTSNLIQVTKFKKPKLSTNNFNFLMIGRLEKVKGPDVLIEASKLIKEKTNKFTITIIGAGSMFEELKNKVKKYGLEKQINILGYVEDQKIVNGYLQFCDTLVVPSRSESFPLVVTEALQTGLPILGSNVGDIPHFVGENKIGYLFCKEDINGLMQQMEKMMKYGREMRVSNKIVMKKLSQQFKLEQIVANFLASMRQYSS